MKKSNLLKVSLVALVSFILILVMWVVTDFFGNPITKYIANKEIRSYIDENYSELDLEIDKVKFSIKWDNYYAKAYSNTTSDIQFVVYYNDGKVQDDSYDEYVLSKINTIERFEKEYSNLATSIINNLGYENKTIVIYDKEYLKEINTSEYLSLGMEFDKTIPLKAEIIMTINLNDISFDVISRLLKEIHNEFVLNNCNFFKYTIYSEKDDIYITVSVTNDYIERENLKELLERALENQNDSIDNSDIYVSINNKN